MYCRKKKKKQYQRYFLLSRNVTNYLRTYVSLQSLVRCCTFQTSPLLNAKKTLTKREKEKKKKKVSNNSSLDFLLTLDDRTNLSKTNLSRFVQASGRSGVYHSQNCKRALRETKQLSEREKKDSWSIRKRL